VKPWYGLRPFGQGLPVPTVQVSRLVGHINGKKEAAVRPSVCGVFAETGWSRIAQQMEPTVEDRTDDGPPTKVGALQRGAE
jgi:hypothetical protein